MRLAFLMRDTEYRDALLEMISEADRNIYLEIGIDSITSSIKNKTMLVTDLSPDEIEEETLLKIKDRTVFISSASRSDSEEDLIYNTIFKYESLSMNLSNITAAYYKWCGEGIPDTGLSKVFAVCGESDSFTGLTSSSLARQVIFHHGGSVLVLPMGSINDYGLEDLKDAGKFNRLMYYVDSDTDYEIGEFIRKDSYGINYLLMPNGINPISYLKSKDILELISSLSRKFETLIIDIGSSYSKTNIMMLRSSDNVVIVRSQQRKFDPGKLLPDDAVLGRDYIQVDISKDKESELSIDSYLMKIYGTEVEANNVSERNNNKK